MSHQPTSSRNMPSRSHGEQSQYSQNQQGQRREFSNQQLSKQHIAREAQRFEVSNHFTRDNAPLEVIFCKYNPLHVVSTSHQKVHEGQECPDRQWNPGQKIIKYNDLDI